MGAEVLGTKAMMQTDNMYPNTARLYAADFTGNADLPYDFFMSRYKEAYKQETLAFVDALVNDKPSPCSGEDGLVALIMQPSSSHCTDAATSEHLTQRCSAALLPAVMAMMSATRPSSPLHGDGLSLT